MENCIYLGKEICTYDLKDKNHYYISELVEEWKIAANEGKLTCTECGSRVYLAAGPIMEPYFAHYDKKTCPYGNQGESEELKKGKRLLYALLKRSFPEQEIHARFKMDNGLYSTCFVSHINNPLAIDYHLQHSGIGKFQERDLYYTNKGIRPLYILGIGKNHKDSQVSWYENLIQKAMGFCVFFDVWKEELLLRKDYDYKVGSKRKIKNCQKHYALEKLLIDSSGSFVCDFGDICQRMEALIKAEIDEYEQNLKARDKLMLEMNYIRPDILENALECLKRGDKHLVSKRYFDYIMAKGLL